MGVLVRSRGRSPWRWPPATAPAPRWEECSSARRGHRQEVGAAPRRPDSERAGSRKPGTMPSRS
eukprot:6055338-Alexandrium_andersonii.AAC.1